jgi:hypothetical protein
MSGWRRWLLGIALCAALIGAWLAWQWPDSEPLSELEAYRQCGFARNPGSVEQVVIGHWRYSSVLVYESTGHGAMSEFRVRREPVTVVARIREWLEGPAPG